MGGASDRAVRYRRGWSRTTAGDHYTNGSTYYGHQLDVGLGTGGDLFFTQFSFLGFDPRGKRDAYLGSHGSPKHGHPRASCRTGPKMGSQTEP